MRGHPTSAKKLPKRNERIIGEMGEDFYEYIIDNRKLPRTAVAKHIGVPKYRLNMYYIDLFGNEAM